MAKLTKDELKQKNYMVDLFGGKDVVDVKKIEKRILNKRKRKTGRVTARDMEDMFGY